MDQGRAESDDISNQREKRSKRQSFEALGRILVFWVELGKARDGFSRLRLSHHSLDLTITILDYHIPIEVFVNVDQQLAESFQGIRDEFFLDFRQITT